MVVYFLLFSERMELSSAIKLVILLNQILFHSCISRDCRIAAFEIFVTLAQDCAENLCDISSQLISRHHSHLSTSKEWEVNIFDCSSFKKGKNCL